MVLAQTFQIFRCGMVGASGLGLSYWFKIFFGWFVQPFNSFLEHVWLKVSLALLPSATVRKMALKIQNMDIQVQHKL